MNLIIAAAGSDPQLNGAGCVCIGAVVLLVLGIFAGRQQKNNHRR